MRKTVIINAVGLTPNLIGQHTPRLQEFATQGRLATLNPVTPAVTCSVQSTFLTGTYPSEHGIVGNGWYFRDECEIKFWRQSNKLVQQPKIWERARALDSTFTCANLFWWYNMYSTADYTITPRPMYPADGRKLPDLYTQPAEIRPAIQAELGQFPLFNFWGPTSSIRSSRWIGDSAKWIEERYRPTLTLIYLPHLDYCLQKYGPDVEQVAPYLRELDDLFGDLLDYYLARAAQVMVLSEYGITPVQRPIHLNRLFREQGMIRVREELGRELLDPGASTAFAVADHQVAHIYVNEPERIPEVRALVEGTPGVGQVLGEEGKRAHHLDHPRSGELVAIAEPDAWFTYYYWLDDERAPDFARTVDIHRKPGYDPVELFVDPQLKLPQAKVALTLLKKTLGFRYLMDLIPLDATLVRGSHGRITDTPGDDPLLMTQQLDQLDADTVDATEVRNIIMRHLTPESVLAEEHVYERV